MCASWPQVGSIEPVGSHPLPSPFARRISIFPKICPSHQNTPNGKKIWHEGGGWRPRFTVFYRARAPTEHGLKDTRRKQQRVRRAETTEHKADGRKRSGCRLAFHDSSSACDIAIDAQRGHKVEAGGLLRASHEGIYWNNSGTYWAASSVPSAPVE